MSHCSATSPAPVASPKLVWLVAGAFFMELLDATVITTALPQMAQSFHTPAINLSTGVSAYMLALAVFIPLSGWLADRFGSRQVFGGAILVFTFASLLCCLSTSLLFFTGARILQGLGGAMMVPVGRLIVLRATPKDQLVNAIATLTWPALAAPVLGPALGGFITTYWGWHWIFLLNLPLGLIGFVLTLILIRAEKSEARSFDLAGFLLSGFGCSAIMFACDQSSHAPFNFPLVGLSGVLGVAAMLVAILHFKRASHPLVDLSALRTPTFAAAMWGGSLFRAAINSAPFLLPLMFQLSFGMSATRSGLMLLALFAGNMCMKTVTTAIMRKWGLRSVLLVNGLLVALGFAACALLTPSTPIILILGLLFLTGLTRSMQFTALSTLCFCDVPSERMNGASTLSSIFVQMSAGLGVAISAILLRLAAVALGVEDSALSVFHIAFWVMALISVAALFDVVFLPVNAGAHVSRAGSGRKG